MNISLYVINISFVNNNLRVTTLNEHLLQFFQATTLFDSFNLCTRNHAITHLRVLEVQSILEYLYFIFDIIFVLSIFYCTLHEMVEVNLRKRTIVLFLIYLYTDQTQKNTSKEGRKTTNRPKDNKKDISQRSEERK